MDSQKLNQKPAESRIVSLKPSDAVDTIPDYGDASTADVRVSCRSSIYRLQQTMRALARSKGISLGELQRDYSLKSVEDGWHDDVITKLIKLSDKTDDLSRLINDPCVDSVLNQSKTFNLGDKGEPATIRIWNEKALDSLKAQAIGCGLDSATYIQLMMLRRLLSYIDWCRVNKKSCIPLGNSEGGLRSTVARFENWLKFRLENREKLVREYGDKCSFT